MDDQVVRGAYWTDWSSSILPVSAVDTRYYTHFYYAFVLVNSDTYRLDISHHQTNTIRAFTAAIHSKNASAKTLLSIGGGSFGGGVFSSMAGGGRATRSAFIESTIEAARRYNLDGFDLDWEHPGTVNDMTNLGLLLQEWRAAIATDARERHRQPLLLTAAVRHTPAFRNWDTGVDLTYPASAIRDNLDWINLMCYDYHGAGWEPNATGAHAALNKLTRDAVAAWLRHGVPAGKLILGIPLYARTWTLANPVNHGIGAPATGPGPGAEDGGYVAYRDLVNRYMTGSNRGTYDRGTVSMYLHAGTSWFSYDDTDSVRAKISFARERRLRGHFVWALDQDLDWTISRAASEAWRG